MSIHIRSRINHALDEGLLGRYVMQSDWMILLCVCHSTSVCQLTLSVTSIWNLSAAPRFPLACGLNPCHIYWPPDVFRRHLHCQAVHLYCSCRHSALPLHMMPTHGVQCEAVGRQQLLHAPSMYRHEVFHFVPSVWLQFWLPLLPLPGSVVCSLIFVHSGLLVGTSTWNFRWQIMYYSVEEIAYMKTLLSWTCNSEYVHLDLLHKWIILSKPYILGLGNSLIQICYYGNVPAVLQFPC